MIPFLAGAVTGSLSVYLLQVLKKKSFVQMKNRILLHAQNEGAQRLAQVEKECKEMREFTHQQLLSLREENQEHFTHQQASLEKKLRLTEAQTREVEREKGALAVSQKQVAQERSACETILKDLNARLENCAEMTREEARKEIECSLKAEVEEELSSWVKRQKAEATRDAQDQARSLVITAINKLAVPCTHEVTLSSVPLPNDEMKGRIIGREGRNIHALERATGVNILIDETPGAVVLSSFDPVRLETAKMTLTDLIQDGRIHPVRIEEAVEKASEQIQTDLVAYGADAAERAGQTGLHPELLTLLGRLKFRHSLGQNVLLHSLEVSHLMGLMASELDLNVQLAKRIGLLHDIGKALTHEVEGTHTQTGHDLALKYGESEEVANGIGCHHQEISPLTFEGSLCSAADAISASRKGARKEAFGEYLKRVRSLEQIARQCEGVEKAYAIQAGKEIRVLVNPNKIDDASSVRLAREITKKVKNSLQRESKIQVTVIREKQVVEWTH